MDKNYSSNSDDAREENMVSCWGRFMLVFSRPAKQRKLKNASNNSSGGGGGGSSFPFSKSKKRAKQSGAFRYSPLSYAQNFDDGVVEWEGDDQDSLFRGFSSRYAAPLASTPPNLENETSTT